jgi:hypothetical protein
MKPLFIFMIILTLQQIAKSNTENEYIKIDMPNLLSNLAKVEQNFFVQLADALKFDLPFEYKIENGIIKKLKCGIVNFDPELQEDYEDNLQADSYVIDMCIYKLYKCRANPAKLKSLQCIFNVLFKEVSDVGLLATIDNPLIKFEDLEKNENLQLSASVNLAVFVTLDNYYIKSNFSPRIIGQRPKYPGKAPEDIKSYLLIIKKSSFELSTSQKLYEFNFSTSADDQYQLVSNLKQQFELDFIKKEEEYSKETVDECGICLEKINGKELYNVHELQSQNKKNKIFHNFHLKCIKEWMNTKRNCPLCREEIKGEIHSNYEAFLKQKEYHLKELEYNFKNIHVLAKLVEQYRNYQGDVQFYQEIDRIEDFNISKYFNDEYLQSIFVNLLKKKLEEHTKAPNFFDISLITQNPSLLIDEMTVILDSLQKCSFNIEFDPRIENDCSKDSISKKLVELVNLMMYKFVNHQYFVNTYKLSIEEAINSTPNQNSIFSLNQEDQFNRLKEVWQLEGIRKMCYELIISSILDKFIFKIYGK